MTLSQASAGCQLRIRQLAGPECKRLREMGFCEEMQICKLSNGRNMICSACGTRLAVNRKLGDQVLVEMC
ncbi:FeoA family protein [Persicirhabdus sediminis]|nr:FeoA family protein [Persicirhabdus sediminis]